jgi:hypothetical protein
MSSFSWNSLRFSGKIRGYCLGRVDESIGLFTSPKEPRSSLPIAGYHALPMCYFVFLSYPDLRCLSRTLIVGFLDVVLAKTLPTCSLMEVPLALAVCVLSAQLFRLPKVLNLYLVLFGKLFRMRLLKLSSQ